MKLQIIGLKEEYNKSELIFGPWSIIHFLTGVIAYILFGLFNIKGGFIIYFIVSFLHEVKDYHRSYILKDRTYYGYNTLINSIGDHLSGIAGYLLTPIVLNRFGYKPNVLLLFVFSYVLIYLKNKFESSRWN